MQVVFFPKNIYKAKISVLYCTDFGKYSIEHKQYILANGSNKYVWSAQMWQTEGSPNHLSSFAAPLKMLFMVPLSDGYVR